MSGLTRAAVSFIQSMMLILSAAAIPPVVDVAVALNVLVAFLFRFAGAFAFWISWGWLINRTMKMLCQTFTRSNLDHTLITYLLNILGVILRVVLIVVILGFFGIQTATLAGILAGAGIAISRNALVAQLDNKTVVGRAIDLLSPCWNLRISFIISLAMLAAATLFWGIISSRTYDRAIDVGALSIVTLPNSLLCLFLLVSRSSNSLRKWILGCGLLAPAIVNLCFLFGVMREVVSTTKDISVGVSGFLLIYAFPFVFFVLFILGAGIGGIIWELKVGLR